MLTFSAAKGAAVAVENESVSFVAFPDKPPADKWSLLSHPEEELINKKAISWPGEYDFSGITLRAIGQEAGRQVSHVCYAEGLRVAFVDTPVLAWTDAEIERLGDVDILVIAADDPKKVQALIESVDPRIIILFEVKDGSLAATAKALGSASPQPMEEFKVKPSTLPTDSRQVVVLK